MPTGPCQTPKSTVFAAGAALLFAAGAGTAPLYRG